MINQVYSINYCQSAAMQYAFVVKRKGKQKTKRLSTSQTQPQLSTLHDCQS